ncbi:hypothetical protein HET69_34325 [Streptomyces sp. CJ_13]|uniref:hypothetical protein n=1 Tax=Streptomyces sp. CJ_13 TaxID=2724943 RepID=UPI001BDBFCC3|nr:hypothetical protein [Streptomyces sp. CJ_13]MBT1188929.1 hypothetical protein [Streptomyces sp. CJ_13]
MLKKALAALGIVLILQSLFALCLVSALQLLVLRDTPFGVTGASPVVNAVASKVSLDTRSFADESAVMEAIGQSKLYGAYLPGQASDTLIVVPAKSFFARVELEAAFGDAAKKLDRPLTVKTVKPLPKYDRLGGVSGLLLIPLLIGGYLAAVLLLKATRTAAAPWHVAMLVGYATVGALLTDLIAGPGIGAYTSDHFWPLLPCFILIAASVALAAAAFQRLIGSLGTLVVATLFIIVGGSAAGGVGVTLLPDYWQHLGAVFPPQHAITLVRNVIYFNGNNITTPLIVLGLYALVGGFIVGYLGRWRPVKMVGAPAPADASDTPDAVEASATQAGGPKTLVRVLVALAIAAVMQCLFTVNYMSSAHEPVATDMPFGAVGPSPLLAATQRNLSLKVSQYPDEQAAKDAIDRAEIYGALIPGPSSNTLLVVPTLSDVAPLDLAANFEVAAKKLGQPLAVQQYAPHPLAKKDPFGLVPSLMLIPLLVGGYMASTMLRAVTGSATGRRRLTAILGFSVLAGLLVNLVVGLWLRGYPLEKFWIVWPILSLVIAGVAAVAAVLQKLLGAAGTLVTVIVVMLFGNPSSGGANGVPYLPAFWTDIGPFLPPRNAYILLRNTIYFDGHGTTQALVVLLLYLAVPAIALALLDRFRTREIPLTRATEAEATALTVPVGGLP